jgi:hypothetical protein
MDRTARRLTAAAMAAAVLILSVIVAPTQPALAAGRCVAATGGVEQRIAAFWQCVGSLGAADLLTAEDLGQWAQNVIERAPGAAIRVVDFRGSTAGMQTAFDRASAGIAPAPPKSSDVEARIAAFWQRVNALGSCDSLTATDLGQWALNVIDRDPSRRILVGDFRTSTAGMQAGLDRASSACGQVASALGYSFLTVEIARGSFGVHLIKERLADVTVRTVTGTTVDCESNCTVKPLADHVTQWGAYAGMNGTYLCPPDYASCAGKVNSFDYTVYHSYLGRWMNPRHLNSLNGMATFNGKTPRFYRRAYEYSRTPEAAPPVTAGISNFPLLLAAGSVVDSEAEQADYQKQRGTKGSIGTDGTHLFLALISNASVTDSAYVLQALGVKDALNVDGGGTAAMYIGGSYKVGPGRLLPNAILLTKP